MRGWEGRVCFTWFHLVCKFPWMFCLARALACVWVLLVLLFCWVGCWFLSLGKFDLNHRLIPVVDRPCLALVRQCRKKKKRKKGIYPSSRQQKRYVLWTMLHSNCRSFLPKHLFVLSGRHVGWSLLTLPSVVVPGIGQSLSTFSLHFALAFFIAVSRPQILQRVYNLSEAGC